MPVGLIGAIAALASAGTAVGTTIYDKVSAPSAPAPPTPAQVTSDAIAQATQQRQAKATADAQLLPGLQADTGGGLSPDALATFSSQFNGDAGGNNPQLQALVSQFLGLNSGAANTFGGSGSFGATNSNPSSPGLVT